MKRINYLTIIHIIIAVLAIGSTQLKGDDIKVEIVPYRLIPANDPYCQINVELIEPVTMTTMPDVYKEELVEILIDRVVFEETSTFAINEVFQIDTVFYKLVRIPNTGDEWSGPWRHSEWRKKHGQGKEVRAE